MLPNGDKVHSHAFSMAKENNEKRNCMLNFMLIMDNLMQ